MKILTQQKLKKYIENHIDRTTVRNILDLVASICEEKSRLDQSSRLNTYWHIIAEDIRTCAFIVDSKT